MYLENTVTSQNKYRINILGNNLYKEVELPSDVKQVKIGTDPECSIRMHKDLFFDTIVLIFTQNDHGWAVSCSDNLYIDTGDVRKLLNLPLENGAVFRVKYQDSSADVFTIEYLLDFESEKKKYERAIDISNVSKLQIGVSPACQVVLNSPYVKEDRISLTKKQSGLELEVENTSYGVYHNGVKIAKNCTLNNGDFFSFSDFAFYYKNGTIWTEIRNGISTSLPYIDNVTPYNYPAFTRNTRMRLKVNTKEIEILDPPSRPVRPKNNILTALLPSISMIVVSGLMAFMGGTSMIIFSAVSAIMAIITALIGIVQANKDFKNETQQRIEKYNNYANQKRQEITTVRNEERAALESIYPNQDSEQRKIFDFSSDLFDRLPSDDDFLAVRLGTGNVEAERKIKYKEQERLEVEDDLQLIPEQIYNAEKILENAPVVCDFKEANAVGIIGSDDARFSLFKNIVIDLVARQYHTDLRLFFISDKENKGKLSWLRFLPHVYNAASGVRNIVCDDESKTRIFDYLYKELSQRNKENAKPHLIVFFYDDCGIQSHPLSKFIASGNELGITFVFMARHKADIPIGCSYLIFAESMTKGTLVKSENREESTDFTYNPISNENAHKIVQFLAPVYTEEISLEGTLTRNISLFEMLDIIDVDDLDLTHRWSSSQVSKSLAAPIGVAKAGLISLDLHDKAHGPHGLVAGTTGSGKSEALQTYILSVATLFHPYEVSFVIIDFKGGGMVNQFRSLPHLLGAITNIDGKEIDRSLKSIKAELQKRQRLFAEVDVNHIDKYIQKFKAGEAQTPIPHLVLIVDEFAELKAEQPDFMKELISTARIGRSLGVHLILATQKPSGQVDDQIWSNSRFKLCLKVQSQEDSNEVLKSPLAAEIKEPGRAYLQVGNNEIFELFQSAYSGAPSKILDSTVKEFTLYSVNETGKKAAIYACKKRKTAGTNETQLDALVAYIDAYCAEHHIEKLSNICLPSLGDRIDFPAEPEKENGLIAIGMYDDPDNQFQGAASIDIDHKNTFIIGSSQYGKTNLLQVMIRSIADTRTPSQANIYIIDFGSMVLKNFEDLHHVGGVVCSSEDEKLKNLFKLMLNDIASRKERLVSVGVSSFASYVEAGYKDIPQIYLFIDNLTALIELYLEEDDSLLTILREGVSVGISVIVGNAQTSGIGYRYLSNFANKIALFSNDSSEYTNLFEHIELTPDEKPGRCVLEIDKRMLECQTYLAFTGEKEIDRVAEMQRFVKVVNSRNGSEKARIIPFIPALLDKDTLQHDYEAEASEYKIPLGLTYLDVAPFYLNLAQLGLIGICGKENTGHKNFISNVLMFLSSIKDTHSSKIAIFDDVTRKYSAFQTLDIVDTYTLNIEQIGTVIETWHAELANRYTNLMETGSMGESSDLLLLIIQNNDAAKKIGDDIDLTEKFTEIMTRYRDMNVAVIFANYPNSPISYDAPEPIRMIKQEQHLLFFEDLDNLKPFDVPYEDIKANRKKVGIGDAYYIKDNTVTKLKIVKTQ